MALDRLRAFARTYATPGTPKTGQVEGDGHGIAAQPIGPAVDDSDERAAIRAEPTLPQPDTPERARLDALEMATLAGYRRAALVRPVSWTDPDALPSAGAWCSCCCGRRWRGDAGGWRCWACNPPLAGAERVREIAT